jgi:hypothetical protein
MCFEQYNCRFLIRALAIELGSPHGCTIEASSCKLQAASCKLQASSCKLQAASFKLQASSCKLLSEEIVH